MDPYITKWQQIPTELQDYKKNGGTELNMRMHITILQALSPIAELYDQIYVSVHAVLKRSENSFHTFVERESKQLLRDTSDSSK